MTEANGSGRNRPRRGEARGSGFDDVSVDASLHKAPFGGESTGPNPTDRGKLGWNWSVTFELDAGPATAAAARYEALGTDWAT
jgi:hypothetical protein